MVQLFVDRSKRVFDLTKVQKPSRRFLDSTSHVDLDPERVAMESRALVTLRYVGQPMRGFDRELFKDLHDDPFLPDPQELVGLQAQLPVGVLQTILESQLCVPFCFWSVHRLDKEMLKRQTLKLRRGKPLLREHQF